MEEKKVYFIKYYTPGSGGFGGNNSYTVVKEMTVKELIEFCNFGTRHIEKIKVIK